jgi:hypothetical protein
MSDPVYPRLASNGAHFTIVLLLAFLPLLLPVWRGHSVDAHFWLANLVVMLALAAGYLLNMRVAVPQLLFRGRWLLYLLLLLGLTVGMAALARGMGVGVQPARLPGSAPGPGHDTVPGRRPASPDESPVIVALTTVFVLGAGTVRSLAQNAEKESKRRRTAETERLEVELAYLRAQLNPHVFFNTLNSIYVLTDLNLPQAKLAIIRLSRLMRYLLYQTHEASVPLSQEITFLEDYVALMKLRLTPNMQVDFEYPDATGTQLLAPMLLQPFIENAFKYGLSTTQPSTIFIRISQSVADRTLTLEVRNPVFAVPQTGFDTGSGIGLTNTRRRLALLYPNRHTLTITERDEAGHFVIHLHLQLT